MVVKKSKSVALDSRDLNPLFSLMKGYGPLMALGIIAVLSVCAAFFIYRSAKGQSKRNGEKSVTEAGEEEEMNPIPKKREVENKHAESTGIMEDAQGMSPADICKVMPEVYPLETSNNSSSSSSGPHDQEEVDEASCPDQLSESCVDAQGAWCESVADYDTVENGSSPTKVGCNGFTDHSEMDDGGQEDAEKQKAMQVQPDDDLVVTQCSEEHQKGFVGDGQMHIFASDSLEELSDCLEKACLKMDLGDMRDKETDDKLSSPDSAYGESEVENGCRTRDQSSSPTNTVDHDFTYYQQSCDDCPTEQTVKHNIFEDEQKTTEALTWSMQAVGKGSEGLMATHRCLPEMQFYKPDYLSFSPVGFAGVMDGCSRIKGEVGTPVRLAPIQSVSSEQDAQVESKSDKTEINIMEATMDNNEWLTGNEGHGDLPWLSLSDGGETSSMAEASQQDVEWDMEKSEASGEFSATCTSSEDDDPGATKRVATVPPMPQTARVTFSVHYITDKPHQFLAVTGNQQELGAWQGFVPLERGKDGFWANTVPLPVDCQVEWKFVLVEDGKICRWEECSNRHLVLTGQEEDVHVQRWWGCL